MADRDVTLSCPTPHAQSEKILMAHGGGGRMMHRLLGDVLLPALGVDPRTERLDSAILSIAARGRVAFTTDSYVVRPLFFPGGDIGSLAVNGTVNDLAMSGARPVWLSVGFILEEGLPIETLRRVCESIGRAASAVGVTVVTGDTKVVERGKGDEIFVTTSGIGIVEHNLDLGPGQVRPGDAILLSGDLGRHGIALMAAREGIRLETALESDCAPLAGPVLRLFEAGVPIHALRDLTRGGLASALVEIAADARLELTIEEDRIPVCPAVHSVCEILGLDPLHVANEGRFIAFVPAEQAKRAVEVLWGEPLAGDARMIGGVAGGSTGRVVMRTRLGTRRIVDMHSGEQLPRIC
jgi:hydrogenase expression/formation protein HypE